MSSFHDDKLWQEAYIALIELLDVTDDLNSDVAVEARKQGMAVLAEIARAVSARRRAVPGIVVPVRSFLSVMWAREMLSDDEFGKLDAMYETLANKLPR